MPVTMQCEPVATEFAELLDWAASGGDKPFELQISSGAAVRTLGCNQLLRLLPDRRIVLAGELDGAPVVVKWFLTDAARYANREQRGVELLHAAGLSTPELLASWSGSDVTGGSARGTQWCGLVFARIPDSVTLTDAALQEQPQLWSQLWAMLAALQGAGVSHSDLHFGNVLLADDVLWLIDGDGVRESDSPVGVEGAKGGVQPASIRAFCRLAAQCQASLSSAELTTHWNSYCAALGKPSQGISEVERSYRVERRRRVLHFQAKTRRTCSAFLQHRTVCGTALLERSWVASAGRESSDPIREVLSWLDDLPAAMEQAEQAQTGVLKAGNTATVARLSYQGEPLVVKRYNNKSGWHRLRRMLRPDRGLNSWTWAHTLDFVGLPTAHCVALLRTRLGGPTYLVMQAVAGEELQPAHLEHNEALCQQLVNLLAALAAEGMVHNDTKASNFLYCEAADSGPGGRTTQALLTLIDLDAMSMPASVAAQRAGAQRDRRRLLRNFAATPELQRRFRSLLGL